MRPSVRLSLFCPLLPSPWVVALLSIYSLCHLRSQVGHLLMQCTCPQPILTCLSSVFQLSGCLLLSASAVQPYEPGYSKDPVGPLDLVSSVDVDHESCFWIVDFGLRIDCDYRLLCMTSSCLLTQSLCLWTLTLLCTFSMFIGSSMCLPSLAPQL